MKSLKIMLTSVFIMLLVSGCGKIKTADGTVKALMDGMKSGDVNEVAVKYTTNPSLLVSDSTSDINGLRDTIFERITYKIKDIKEYDSSDEKYEKEATISIEIKNIDITAVTLYLKNTLLVNDDSYSALAGEAKQNYYDTLQITTIEKTKDENLFKTDVVELELVKEKGTWKIKLNNSFLYSILGMRY